MKYNQYDTETGEFTEVYELEDCLKAIRVRNRDNEDIIKELKEENKALREGYYKDELIQKMQQKLDRMEEEYYRGFPISKEEENAIDEWKSNHDREAHNNSTAGAIGGRYSYYFVPTSIGVIGTIKCSCGAEFCFTDFDLM